MSLDAVLYDSRLAGQVPDHRQHGDAPELGPHAGVRVVDRRLSSGLQAAAEFSGARAPRDHVQQQPTISGCVPRATSRSRRTRCSSARRSSCTPRAGGFSDRRGSLGYDVLIQFDPFAFVADFYASVQLKYHSHNLFKVKVEGELSGPRPLHIKGKATFEIFWCDFSVRFDQHAGRAAIRRRARLP